MLTGLPAFEGTSAVVLMHCHLNEPAPRASAKVPEIPVALDDLIVKLMAKAPADRPWDAAAVGTALTELRDQLNRGEKVAMVWSEEQADAMHPSRAGLEKSKKSKKKRASSRSAIVASSSTRAWIETGLLVLALVGIGGLIAYMLWPPSKEYLYQRAGELMVSPQRRDWMRARDDFLDPLDQRFPTHPWRKTTEEWRDRIRLFDAEKRAAMLEVGEVTDFNRPKSEAERWFVQYFRLASRASKDGDDPLALYQWEQMARQLDPPDTTEQQGWYLLAKKRAQEVKDRMEQRRKIVGEQLALADQEESRGRQSRAKDIRNQIYQEYSRYKDLAEYLTNRLGPDFAGAASQTPPAPAPPAQTNPPATTTHGGAAPEGVSSGTVPGAATPTNPRENAPEKRPPQNP
jgi:serine/threonine-protein kinase